MSSNYVYVYKVHFLFCVFMNVNMNDLTYIFYFFREHFIELYWFEFHIIPFNVFILDYKLSIVI